jgi:protein-disulfide isomerase
MSDATLTPPAGEHDHAMGPADAPVTLVEYGDFECPYCGQAYPIVKAIQERMGRRLRFVFRHFPISESHPHAEHAAETAEAAGAQGKFWEMHDVLYEHQRALSDRDLIGYAAGLGLDQTRVARELGQGTFAAKVRGDFRGGVRSGVNGTPTFFIDGMRYDGSWTDPAEFLRALEATAR